MSSLWSTRHETSIKRQRGSKHDDSRSLWNKKGTSRDLYFHPCEVPKRFLPHHQIWKLLKRQKIPESPKRKWNAMLRRKLAGWTTTWQQFKVSRDSIIKRRNWIFETLIIEWFPSVHHTWTLVLFIFRELSSFDTLIFEVNLAHFLISSFVQGVQLCIRSANHFCWQSLIRLVWRLQSFFVLNHWSLEHWLYFEHLRPLLKFSIIEINFIWNLWEQTKRIGIHWNPLTTFESHWKLLTTIEKYWNSKESIVSSRRNF